MAFTKLIFAALLLACLTSSSGRKLLDAADVLEDITDDAVEEAQEPFITPLTFSIPLPETTTAPSIIVGSEPASEMDTTLLEEALLEDLTPVEEGLGRRKLMDAADVLDDIRQDAIDAALEKTSIPLTYGIPATELPSFYEVVGTDGPTVETVLGEGINDVVNDVYTALEGDGLSEAATPSPEDI